MVRSSVAPAVPVSLGLLFSLGCLVGACSSGGGASTAIPNIAVDGGEENETPDDDASTKRDAASPKKDGGTQPSAGDLRIGPERLSSSPTPGAVDTSSTIVRCPAGAVIIALDVAGPAPDAGIPDPENAENVRLHCAPVQPDGSLAATKIVTDVAAVLPPGWQYRTLACPADQVATRLVGSAAGGDVLSLGLRCQSLATLADGGALTAGAAAQPATYGAPGGVAFDQPCADGTALAGLVYAHEWDFGSGSAAGFDALRTVCRDVLRDTVPGGEAFDPNTPVTLGSPTTTQPLSTGSGGLPSVTSTITRDCPPGSVVTAINGGRSSGNAAAPLLDLQITCQALRADGVVAGTPTDVGGASYSRASACLVGSAVTGMSFSSVLLAGQYKLAEDVRVDCAVPVPVGSRASDPIPAWVPGSGPFDPSTPAWASIACPDGAVMVGMDIWAPELDPGETTLGGVELHCRKPTVD